jgi:hypothetical protein
MGEGAAIVNLGDEVLDHRLGDFEIGDDAVAQRADRLDVAGGAAQHHLGFLADRQNLTLAALGGEGHDRRLVQHDAPTLDVDQRVGRAEVDPHVGREKPNDARQHSLSLCNYWETPPRDSVPELAIEVRRFRPTGRAKQGYSSTQPPQLLARRRQLAEARAFS